MMSLKFCVILLCIHLLTGVQGLSRCHQLKEAGPCRGRHPRYYFNMDNSKCEFFFYGGCWGNSNNFKTLKDCERICVQRCQQPMKVGKCKEYRQRYYFNKDFGICTRFYYGGCHGNLNNFETIQECETACVPRCQQPKRAGTCRRHVPRYYFNKYHSKCEVFFYGGCGNNLNNFKTRKECDEACVPRCQQPKKVGTCRKHIPRYYFNKYHSKCEVFFYGGCGNNLNNFETRKECEEACTEVLTIR